MMLDGLELKWLGHSSFLISNKERIYIDPYKLKNRTRSSRELEPEKADIILITHSHYDHCSIEDLMKIVKDGTIVVMPADCSSKFSRINKKIIIYNLEPGESVKLGDIDVKAVPAYNVNKSFHGRAEYWNGYVLTIDGKKIYHAGDTDLIPEMNQLENIDVALLPIGGTYTMSAEEAARAAILIRPKLTMPMHYNSIVGSREDAIKFMQACENEGVACKILERE